MLPFFDLNFSQICGAAGVARETEDGVSCLSAAILFTYKKNPRNYAFPGGLKLQVTVLLLPVSRRCQPALLKAQPLPRLFSESHFWTN